MKQIKLTKLFLIAIIISSVATFPFILDPTLTPRFITLSVCLALGLYFIYKTDTSFTIKADLILLSYASYTSVCCLSVVWSNTSSEDIFESSKQLLNLFVFSFTYFILKTDHSFFIKSFLKTSIILFSFALLIAVFQISNLENFDKESLYQIKSLQGHKNLFSSFLFLNLFFLIMAFYKLEAIWKWSALACILLSLLLLIFLRTKAVWIGGAITIILGSLTCLFSKKNSTPILRINFAVFVVGALVLLNSLFLIFLQPVIGKSIDYITQTDSSNVLTGIKLEQERLLLWDKLIIS